jgi:hypothetical protein
MDINQAFLWATIFWNFAMFSIWNNTNHLNVLVKMIFLAFGVIGILIAAKVL